MKKANARQTSGSTATIERTEYRQPLEENPQEWMGQRELTPDNLVEDLKDRALFMHDDTAAQLLRDHDLYPDEDEIAELRERDMKRVPLSTANADGRVTQAPGPIRTDRNRTSA